MGTWLFKLTSQMQMDVMLAPPFFFLLAVETGMPRPQWPNGQQGLSVGLLNQSVIPLISSSFNYSFIHSILPCWAVTDFLLSFPQPPEERRPSDIH